MKKRLAVVLSAIMALTMFGGQFAFAASGDQFTDVPSDAWYKPDVDYVAENDYMIGTSDTTFEPQSNLTRAMFATILARYDGAEVDDSVPTIFTDVEVNQWFTGSIGWANDKKIVEGRGDNIFDPTSFITRQELAVMVERYITYVESTTDKVHVTPGVAIPFTDADQISDYAKDAMDKAVIHGLIIGYPDKSVKPLQNITRAETAAVIHRIKWKTRDGRENYTLTYQDYESNVIATVDVPVGQLVEIGKGITNPEGPEGTTFVGWQYTAPDGTVTTYHPGDKIQLSDDMVLVPVFSDGKESHDITLIDAVNDSEISKTTVPSGETFTIPAGPEKSGYTFKEWNTQKDGKGTTYKPESTIELVSDMTLYAIYTKKSSGGGSVTKQDYYQVVMTLDVPDGVTDKDPELLTKQYTKAQAADMTMDDVVLELISSTNNNDQAIKNAFDSALEKVKAQKFAGGEYTVEIDKDGVITAKRKGHRVNLKEQLVPEKATYDARMAEIKTVAAIDSKKWGNFVEKCWVGNLFDFADPYAPKLLENGDAYYQVVSDAVNAAVDLHKDLKDSGYDFANGVQKVAEWAEAKGINYNGYTINEGTVTNPTDVLNGTRVIGALNYDTNIILDVLGDANEHVVLDATETIGGTGTDLMKLINDRTSMDFSDHDGGFEAIMDAVVSNGSLLGDYNVKVVVKKVTK